MVKKWIVILSIIGILIVGCFLENNFVNSTFDNMVTEFTTFRSMLEATKENIDTQENIEFITNLHSEFHKQEKVLKSLIWHTGLKEVEIGMSRILTYVEENDFTEALTETNALLDYFEHYSLDFNISLENIL